MKSLLKVVAVAVIISAPVASFAQSTEPVTRQQVRAELIQLEKAGYSPVAENTQYPAGLVSAEARVAAQPGVASAGGSSYGSQSSGAAVSKADWNSMYLR